MCTGFLSYSGPFNQEFRNKLLQDWQKKLNMKRVPFSLNLNITDMLVDNATVSCNFTFTKFTICAHLYSLTSEYCFILEWTTSLDTSSSTLFVRICVGMSTSCRMSSYVITSDCY